MIVQKKYNSMLSSLHEIAVCLLLCVCEPEVCFEGRNPELHFVVQIAVQASAMRFNYLKRLRFRKTFLAERGIEIMHKQC